MTREERWREAVDRYFAPAGMALADEEQAALRAVVEGLRTQLQTARAGWQTACDLGSVADAVRYALQVRVDAVKALADEVDRTPNSGGIVETSEIRAALAGSVGVSDD